MFDVLLFLILGLAWFNVTEINEVPINKQKVRETFTEVFRTAIIYTPITPRGADKVKHGMLEGRERCDQNVQMA